MFPDLVRRPFWRRRPWLTAFGALTLFWCFQHGWYPLAAAIGVLAGSLLIVSHARSQAARRAGLLARAQHEHALTLAGDPRGVHGRYPPVQAGWFPDPANHIQLRYYDGAAWSWRTAAR